MPLDRSGGTPFVHIRPDQLATHLQGELAAIYLVAGDEPLQHAEFADAIRSGARERGYTERVVLDAAQGFDWGALGEAGANRSLFGDRTLIDLRLATGKPGRDGGAALKAWAEAPPEDTLLLITTPKIERQAQQSAWYRALERAGVTLTATAPPRERLPQWLTARMQARGLQPDRTATALLADRVEGNLVAAAHEVDKLLLLHGPGAVDADTVRAAVTDSTRYGAFDLGDAVVAGETGRIGHIVATLRAEGVAPPLVIWALHREVEQLATVAARAAAGESLAAAMQAAGVWQRRQEHVRGAVKRHPAGAWAQLLAGLARLDRVAKGAERGSFWEELVELALTAGGADMPALTPRRTVGASR